MVHLSCSLPRSHMLWLSRFGTQSLCWSLRRSATPHFFPLSRSTVSTYAACLRSAHRQFCMVTLSVARRFWPWAALVLGRFITWPLRSAASILSDGRSHPLSIHAIPAQAAGIGTRSLGTGYIPQPFSGGVVFYFYFFKFYFYFLLFLFFVVSPIIVRHFSGVWCSYSSCLSTLYVEWTFKTKQKTIVSGSAVAAVCAMRSL